MDVTSDYDGGSDIPDFIQLDQIPANYAQRLETDLLEPVLRGDRQRSNMRCEETKRARLQLPEDRALSLV